MNPSSMFKTETHAANYLSAYDQCLSLWNVEYDSIYVKTEYGSTHVLVCGPENGEPVILLHGFGFSATMWYPNVSSLAAEFRVYAVDVMGEFNRSITEKHFRSKADYAAWLTQLMDGLGIEKASFVGHSNGGWHALNFAGHLPDRVERLALLAPAASFARFNMQFPIRLLAANVIRTRSVIIEFCGKWFRAKGNSVRDELFELFYHGLKGFAWKYKIIIPSVFSDDELIRIKVPVLLLIGDKEVIYNAKKVFKRAQNVIPHIRTHLVPGAGHALSIEKAEIVNQHIMQFLKAGHLEAGV